MNPGEADFPRCVSKRNRNPKYAITQTRISEITGVIIVTKSAPIDMVLASSSSLKLGLAVYGGISDPKFVSTRFVFLSCLNQTWFNFNVLVFAVLPVEPHVVWVDRRRPQVMGRQIRDRGNLRDRAPRHERPLCTTFQIRKFGQESGSPDFFL